MEFFNF